MPRSLTTHKAVSSRASIGEIDPGGIPAAWQIVHDSPGLEDLWQLHYAAESDKDHNVAEDRIANVKENCEGKYIKVTAEADGAFTVTNARTSVSKTYSKP